MQTSLTMIIYHHCKKTSFVCISIHSIKGEGFVGVLLFLVTFFLAYNFESLLLHESASSLFTK